MEGKVVRITDKGFGFIKGQDNVEYFFHKSALRGAIFEALTEGERVDFTPDEGPKGPRAENIELL